jgi:hypothetical protein
MYWYYVITDNDVSVRVSINGQEAGILTMTLPEFNGIKRRALAASPNSPIFGFIEEE